MSRRTEGYIAYIMGFIKSSHGLINLVTEGYEPLNQFKVCPRHLRAHNHSLRDCICL